MNTTNDLIRTIAGIVSLAALVLAFVIVKVWGIGPVILTVSKKYGLGVHTGDFLAVPVLAVAAAAAYVAVS
jgi:hypothetical protein